MLYALCLPAVGMALCEGLHDLRLTMKDTLCAMPSAMF